MSRHRNITIFYLVLVNIALGATAIADILVFNSVTMNDLCPFFSRVFVSAIVYGLSALLFVSVIATDYIVYKKQSLEALTEALGWKEDE